MADISLDSAMTVARKAKHLGFLVSKRSRVATRPLRRAIVDGAYMALGKLRPYQFNAGRYAGHFLAGTATRAPLAEGPAAARSGDLRTASATPLPVPRELTMFWLGTAEMSENRRRNLATTQDVCGDLDVRLITDADLGGVEVPSWPFHPAYQYLARTHQADYLRCYLMHTRGGGYADVKAATESWAPALELLDRSPDKWAAGYRELNHSSSTDLPGPALRDVRRNFFRIIGNSGFIMRPRTPLTTEWFVEMHRRLDGYAAALEREPGGIRGGEEDGDYPVPKHALLADILAPLGLKYREHLIIDERLLLEFTDYL